MKRSNLGHLQLELLTALWSQRMYGLEIRNFLKMRGRFVSASQLYPALSKLEELEYITQVDRPDAEPNIRDRIYYETSAKGKDEVIAYLNYVFMLLADVAIERVYPHVDQLLGMMKLRSGVNIVDFSSRIFDRFVSDISAMIDITSRYFITSKNSEQNRFLEERINFYDMKDTVQILPVAAKTTELADDSVDIVLVYFTMNEVDTDWLFEEIPRVLKPGGDCYIVEALEPANNAALDTFLAFIPVASSFGIVPSTFEQKVKEKHLSIISNSEKNGILYYHLRK